jgi:hypothetical protein
MEIAQADQQKYRSINTEEQESTSARSTITFGRGKL